MYLLYLYNVTLYSVGHKTTKSVVFCFYYYFTHFLCGYNIFEDYVAIFYAHISTNQYLCTKNNTTLSVCRKSQNLVLKARNLESFPAPIIYTHLILSLNIDGYNL